MSPLSEKVGGRVLVPPPNCPHERSCVVHSAEKHVLREWRKVIVSTRWVDP